MDVSKLKYDNTPIIIEAANPAIKGSNFIGILFNEFLGMSYLTLGLSVGTTVTLMMYFKIIHPPAAANPLIALFADVSLSYIVFPVIVGSIVIIVLSVTINRYLLKRNYPVRWF